MLKKISFFVLMSCCAAMMANANVHAIVGTRAESAEQRSAHLETRSAMAATYPEGIASLAKNSKGMKSVKSFAFLQPSISYAVHPASYQEAVFFYSPECNSMMAELTDGSTWFVNPLEVDALSDWSPLHQVIITENHAWRSPYAFRLTNQWTGQSVGINIELGPIAPIYGTNQTYWIHDIDYHNNVIWLTQGYEYSKWDMSIFDANTVRQWMRGDVVIIGVNDGWLFAYNPNMLINVATLDFAVGGASY